MSARLHYPPKNFDCHKYDEFQFPFICFPLLLLVDYFLISSEGITVSLEDRCRRLGHVLAQTQRSYKGNNSTLLSTIREFWIFSHAALSVCTALTAFFFFYFNKTRVNRSYVELMRTHTILYPLVTSIFLFFLLHQFRSPVDLALVGLWKKVVHDFR